LTLDWPIAARAINDGSSLAWFGLALAPAYGGARLASVQRIAGALALISLAASAVLTMMDIVGPGGALDGTELSTFLGQTSFGHIWALRGVLCIGALVLASRSHVSVTLTGLQLALLGFAGHAFARGGLPGAASEALHLLAAGAWVGGALALALQRHDVLERAARFSKPGYAIASITPVAAIAVLALVTGGVVPDVETGYGGLAAAKLVLFVVLLTLAGTNRFYALPRANIAALRAGIVAELMVMAALNLTAATLAATSPSM
jgi:putative copper resistance protein D